MNLSLILGLLLPCLPLLSSAEQPISDSLGDNDGNGIHACPFFCESCAPPPPFAYHPSYRCPPCGKNSTIAYQALISPHSPSIGQAYPSDEELALDSPLAEYARLLKKYWHGEEDALGHALNYRSNWEYVSKHPNDGRLAGLDAYYASMSRQLSRLEFDTLFLRHVVFALSRRAHASQTNPIWLYYIDLRLESHGFVNGLPIYFRCAYNWALAGLSPQAAALDEQWRLHDLGTACPQTSGLRLDTRRDDSGRRRRMQRNRTLIVPSLFNVSAEQSLVDHYQGLLASSGLAKLIAAEYVRWRVLDHAGPGLSVIDDFVRLVRSHGPSGHRAGTTPIFHFHCLAGKGRTTTFSSLLDILHNAPKGVPLASIRARQAALNSYRLKRHRRRADRRGTPSDEAIHKRYRMISIFYDYVCANNPLESGHAITFEDYCRLKDEK